MSTHSRKNPADRNLGHRIELARRRRGLTQEALAEKIGVTGAAISHWENGRHEPPRDMMLPLASALVRSIGWLSGETVTEDTVEFEKFFLQLLIEAAKSSPEAAEALERQLARFTSIDELIAHLAKFKGKTP